ncbi:putative ATPase/DNA-binding SARP family transcriptional activator [Curtobacterium luteum]|uniref:ATPase/DNA-binding SARP family transcriptional activator n=1 Tax=Curtobacterium luteum TaxID=33881 RepID=A0ABS2RVJ1_9MICO|nr:BTAD domain-containing putative transcriptional regulator [Curtobacterium luteum]MBM7803038.1 putative ATPase/DNA-binding SARP family transcriptional activator [Curtobacterium luteum]
MTARPRLAVLGPVLVEGPSGEPTTVTGALARSFLTALALAPGRSLSTGSLIDELWPDDQPRGARAALQTMVSRLRRTTAEGLVRSTATGYALGCDTDDVDLLRTERAAATPDVDALESALALWRGAPGEDVEGDLGDALAGRARAARRALRRALGSALLDLGRADDAAEVWSAEVAADPVDEVAVAGAMQALDAAGRPAVAVAVFAAHRERLVEELGADPSAELVRHNADLLRRSAAESGRARRIGLRAAPNALVGREADLAAVTDLLSRGRLVTILGPGGLGKTRLAQAVAADLPDGTAVVVAELASIAAAEDVVPALGAVLGIAEVRSARTLRDPVVTDLWGRVVRALADGPTVLVLDNCEHLLDAVAALTAELLAAAPELRVLTTSRAPLAIAGEVVAPLAPLPVEDDGAAVRLFTERARAARPGAVLPVDAVRRICARLDGSPLAIELAAARIRGMSTDEIERRLDDRFALLRGGDRSAPERHRTLLAVIEWSWRLLGASAQDLLPRLALFPDGLAVDAVEAVASEGHEDALDDLADLVEQSLVQLVEREGEPVRYRLLETVREFGAARLTERGRTEDVRSAMVDWARAFAADRNLLAIAGPEQTERFHEVRREADNLVVLLRWALRAEDAPAAAQLFAALGAYWTLRGTQGEITAVGPDVVGLLRREPPAPDDRVAAHVCLVVVGVAAAFDDRRTTAWARSTLRRWRRTSTAGQPVVDALVAVFLTVGRPAEATALLARLRDDPEDGVACIANLLSAPLAENDGDPASALRYAAAAQALAARTGDAWTTGTSAVTMTQLLAQSGRYDEALTVAEAARDRLERFGADDDLSEIGWSVGLAAAAIGDVDRARSVARDLQHRPAGGRGPEADGSQVAVVVLAIEAECRRAEGDPAAAAEQYTAAWEVAAERRGPAPNWRLMAGAARIAAVDETRGGGAGLTDAEREVARRMRNATLALLRVRPWWTDLPVVGTTLAGLAVAAARDGLTGEAARCWALARRFGTRQDFAVLAHARLRPLLAAAVGDDVLANAETASARWERDEAEAATRVLLEDLRDAVRRRHRD